MCRWMAWSGQDVLLDELLFKPRHGLIDQSRHARMGVETTNGDGFGVGWYGAGAGPAVYRSVAPAWSDENLRELAGHVESRLFLAHVRAATGTPVQGTNCHPFRYRDWLFAHNGAIGDFPAVHRDLVLAVDASLFQRIRGSTDSEVLFFLALTFGLEHEPQPALERAVGFVERAARARGWEPRVQASIGLTDGSHVWAVRYSTERRSRTLFVSADADALRRLHPDNPRLQRLREGDRLVVSEPIADLPGAWHELPEASVLTLGPDGALEQRAFAPRG